MTAATYATSTNSTWKHGDRPLLFVRPFGDAAHWLTDVQSVIITTARRRCDDDRESNYDETERHFRCRRLFVFIHNDSVAVALCSIFGGYWGIATPIIEGSSDCSAGSWGWDRRFGIWFILFLGLQKLAEAWCGKCFPWCLFAWIGWWFVEPSQEMISPSAVVWVMMKQRLMSLCSHCMVQLHVYIYKSPQLMIITHTQFSINCT